MRSFGHHPRRRRNGGQRPPIRYWPGCLGQIRPVFVADLVSGQCQQANQASTARRQRRSAAASARLPSRRRRQPRTDVVRFGFEETEPAGYREDGGNQGQRGRNRDQHAHRARHAHGLEDRQSGETEAIRRPGDGQAGGQDHVSHPAVCGVVGRLPIFAGLASFVIAPDEEYPIVGSRGDGEGHEDGDSKGRKTDNTEMAQ